jgi:hypothetical protein
MARDDLGSGVARLAKYEDEDVERTEHGPDASGPASARSTG